MRKKIDKYTQQTTKNYLNIHIYLKKHIKMHSLCDKHLTKKYLLLLYMYHAYDC